MTIQTTTEALHLDLAYASSTFVIKIYTLVATVTSFVKYQSHFSIEHNNGKFYGDNQSGVDMSIMKLLKLHMIHRVHTL